MPEPLDFQTLHATHRAAIERFLRRMVGEGEAEDLTQVVFERANRSLEEFRGESSVTTWLYRIATNVALDLLRSSTFRRRDVPLEDDVAPAASAQATRPPDSEDQAVRNEMNACIRGIVDSLPANYRTVLVLADLEGFTNAEVAERLGLSVDTTKIRLHRARAHLRKALEQACRFYRTEFDQLACDRKQPGD